MTAADRLAALVNEHRMGRGMTFYRNGTCKLPTCSCGEEMHPNEYGRHLAAAVAAAEDLAVVELPKPYPLEVTGINCDPTPLYHSPDDYDQDVSGPAIDGGRPWLLIRFNHDMPAPGRLFDRTRLAAALLAANRVEKARGR